MVLDIVDLRRYCSSYEVRDYYERETKVLCNSCSTNLSGYGLWRWFRHKSSSGDKSIDKESVMYCSAPGLNAIFGNCWMIILQMLYSGWLVGRWCTINEMTLG
jgi:hypothetical protein